MNKYSNKCIARGVVVSSS